LLTPLQFGSAKTSPQLTRSTLGLGDGTKDDMKDGTKDDDASVSDTSGQSDSSSPVDNVYDCTIAKELPPQPISPHLSRSPSPIPKTGSGLGSRTASPVSFGYPYHQSMNQGFFETHTATAIQG
jgi:hypothetical protein